MAAVESVGPYYKYMLDRAFQRKNDFELEIMKNHEDQLGARFTILFYQWRNG
jgi:hypothetical protein